MIEQLVTISVIGGASATPEFLKLAEEVGREIARRGAALVCGGLEGVMEAACKGAAEAGGLTIGILPGTRREDCNQYVKLPIVTSIGYARNVIVAKSGQAVIAIDGSYGTLSEIAYALQAGIPVIGLKTWSMSINGKTENEIIIADNAADAVQKAMDAIAMLPS